MKYAITYGNPTGTGEVQTVEIECERVEIDEQRHTLRALDADGNVTAAFVAWYSFVPVEA